MHIAILVFKAEIKELAPGSALIKAAVEKAGHEVSIVQESDVQIHYGKHPNLFMHGKPVPDFDAVIVRPLFKRDPSIHSSIIRQFELNGFLVINGYLGVHRAKNKIRTLQLLDHFNLPMPKTVVLFGTNDLNETLKDFKFPVIVKAAYGSAGTGIFIAETKRSVTPIIEYLLKEGGENDPIKIQEYIKESKGKDLRVFVLGKKVVAAMQRSAKKGEFRSNFHKGGSVKSIKLTAEETDLAIRASQHMGLNISGVDILRTERGPVIIEVNSCPGLEGITQATGIDVAAEIVKYVEKKIRSRKHKNGVREKSSKKSEA